MSSFEIFLQNISSYPTIVFTGMLLFVTLYWLTSLLGLTDMDTVDFGDVGGGDIGGDMSGGDVGDTHIGFFASIMMKFGLHGVPFIIILTMVSLIGWLLSFFYSMFLNSHFPSGMLHYAFGTGALVLVFIISMFVTGLIIAPIRKKFAPPPKKDAKSLIGKTALVRSFKVNTIHGEAVLEDGGAGLILKVRTFDDVEFSKGDKVSLVEYLSEENVYKVVAEEEYLG